MILIFWLTLLIIFFLVIWIIINSKINFNPQYFVNFLEIWGIKLVNCIHHPLFVEYLFRFEANIFLSVITSLRSASLYSWFSTFNWKDALGATTFLHRLCFKVLIKSWNWRIKSRSIINSLITLDGISLSLLSQCSLGMGWNYHFTLRCICVGILVWLSHENTSFLSSC